MKRPSKNKPGFTIEDLQKAACAHLNPHLFDEKKDLGKKNKVGNKFGAKIVEIDGHRFGSKKEAKRYGELKMLLKAGLIGQLELQKKFLLIEANDKERKCEYWADFVYLDAKTGELVVEDTKSDPTRNMLAYIMKRKLMYSKLGIIIKEL